MGKYFIKIISIVEVEIETITLSGTIQISNISDLSYNYAMIQLFTNGNTDNGILIGETSILSGIATSIINWTINVPVPVNDPEKDITGVSIAVSKGSASSNFWRDDNRYFTTGKSPENITNYLFSVFNEKIGSDNISDIEIELTAWF